MDAVITPTTTYDLSAWSPASRDALATVGSRRRDIDVTWVDTHLAVAAARSRPGRRPDRVPQRVRVARA